MMDSLRNASLAALGGIVLTSLVGADLAAAQSFDHLTCVGVQRDLRSADMPPPLTLTSAQIEFLSSQGCQPVGGGRSARADEVCFATNKSPSNPPGGVELTGQDFLCYRVRCEPNGGSNTEIEIGDQFGSGTIVANQRPVTKRLCVPAFKPGVATPTPTPAATPTATPSPTVVGPTPTPGPTASPSPSPSPTATPPYGSASKAFVEGVPSILD